MTLQIVCRKDTNGFQNKKLEKKKANLRKLSKECKGLSALQEVIFTDVQRWPQPWVLASFRVSVLRE